MLWGRAGAVVALGPTGASESGRIDGAGQGPDA
jgi:hypothetical protein